MAAVIWKGAINFGLINIPVGLSLATKREYPSFRSLHKECGNPINHKRFCSACNKEVGQEEIVRGYEYQKGKFVVIDDEDFESLPIKSAKYIQLVDFVELEDVDPIYFDKTYYLAPLANGEKSYLMLYKAMKESNRAAVGKVTIREREHLCIVRVYLGALALNTMYFDDEVRTAAEFDADKVEKKFDISPLERQLAKQLIDNLTAKFDISKYHDEYRVELRKLIEAKIEGEEIVTPKVKSIDEGKFKDLLERLRASVEATSGGDGGASSRAVSGGDGGASSRAVSGGDASDGKKRAARKVVKKVEEKKEVKKKA